MKSLVLAVTISSLLFPVISLAQNRSEVDSGLVPCGYDDEYDCNTDDLVALAASVIDFLIKMLGVIAVLAMVYAGFQMVVSGGDTGAWTRAKQSFSNVVIGIIIILSAWLVVDLVLRMLTGDGLDHWSNFRL